MNFFEFELPYFIMGAFFTIAAAFISTRPFMSKNAYKIWIPSVAGFFLIFIIIHYNVTISRMDDVESGFNDNKRILCENRSDKAAAKVLAVKKGPWRLENHYFINDEVLGKFHTSRCLVDTLYQGQ